MAIQKVKLYLYEYINYRAPERYATAYQEHAMDHMKNDVVLIGETEVDIDFPEIDTRQAQIDALESAIKIERADSQVRVNLLLDRISKLKAITHEVAQ